jgi:hypothetical protein
MTDDKADSTQPIAAPGKCHYCFMPLDDVAQLHRIEDCNKFLYGEAAVLDTLTQQVADLQAEVAKLREALEFVGDHLEGELGLLSADDYDIEYGTNETVIIAFNKVMEALQSGRRIRVWQD